MFDWLLRRSNSRAADPELLGRARAALEAGQDADAAAQLDALLRHHPADPDALYLRAVAACRAREFDQATRLLEAANHADGNRIDPLLVLAEVHYECRRYGEAVRVLRDALALDPGRGPAQQRLLQCLAAAGEDDAAVEYYQLLRGLDWRVDPAANPVAVLHAQGRLVEAEASLEGRTRHAPDDHRLHVLLGITRQARGFVDAAVASFREAVRCGPGDARAAAKLAFALESTGEVAEALPHYRRAAELQPAVPQAWSDWLSARLYAGIEPRSASEAACAEYANRFSCPGAPHANDRNPDRRLRIGYVSNDFCDHVIRYFLEPVLERHDRRDFEVWCYDRTPNRDAASIAMQDRVDGWRRVAGLDFDSIANRIREDGIDILVDLKGHFDDNALPLFAAKPAPVQFTWLGYPDTTGLAAVDGWITDEHIASGLRDQHAAERIVALPGFFMCFRPQPGAPDPGPLPALANGHITFGSFNAYPKVSPPMREALVRLLAQAPQARLLMTAVPRGEARRRLLDRFEAGGVDPARVEFRSRGTHAEFLSWHREVDLCLDSFPYNGTTTTLHALWMGVPFVALAGTTHVSRVGASLLANVGLEDWIARDPDDYVDLALARSADRAGLARLRAQLRERLAASPLMDEAGFARRLEQAYRMAWQRWCNTA